MPGGILSVAAASKDEKEKTSLNSTLCEDSYWYVLVDNSIMHPAQTARVGWINGRSALALFFSLWGRREKGVGQIPELINKWMSRGKGNAKKSFYSSWCCPPLWDGFTGTWSISDASWALKLHISDAFVTFSLLSFSSLFPCLLLTAEGCLFPLCVSSLHLLHLLLLPDSYLYCGRASLLCTLGSTRTAQPAIRRHVK